VRGPASSLTIAVCLSIGTYRTRLRVPRPTRKEKQLLFSIEGNPGPMAEADRCELHEVAILAGPGETETLLRLARSPIADECQICAVCRSAREFIELRLAEQRGQVFPPQRSSEAARKQLQTAILRVKATIRQPPEPRRS